MEANPTAGAGLTVVSGLSRACARCHARKVKCDLRIPQCTSCQKQQEPCNITDCVAYSHDTVQRLVAQIQHLQTRLEAATAHNSHRGTSSVPAASSTLNEQQVQSEAEELGVLAVGRSNRTDLRSSYVGSATGTTFARIFFKQLGLAPLQLHAEGDEAFSHEITCQNAVLPPPKVTSYLYEVYIARIHTFWPLFDLASLRSKLRVIYHSPRSCNLHDKFVVFMVLALASAHCTHDTVYQRMFDANTPRAYYQTALRLFSSLTDSPRNIADLQRITLVGLWARQTGWDANMDDLWHLSRHAMSAAVQLGIHRRGNRWDHTLQNMEDIETRTRTWWCIYNLERSTAIATGRVLSVREHGIDAPLPSTRPSDSLTDTEARTAPAFQHHGVEIFHRIIHLRRLGGRILESVYIARGSDGRAPLTTFQQICNEFEKIRIDLDEWKKALDSMEIRGSREHSELELEYCQLLLMMHRPSPTFMIPSVDMVGVCSEAIHISVRHWRHLDTNYGISAVCQSSTQLHQIVLVALAGLYCDWYVNNVSGTASTPEYIHQVDLDHCLDFMNRSIAQLHAHQPEADFNRYKQLLISVKSMVYTSRSSSITRSQDTNMSSGGAVDPTMMTDLPDPLGFTMDAHVDLTINQGMEAYMSQVSGIFDNSFVGLDQNLTAWHDAIMAEIQCSNTED